MKNKNKVRKAQKPNPQLQMQLQALALIEIINHEGKDEFGILGVDNTPNKPDAHKSFDGNEFANQPNDGSTHGRGQKNNPHGNPQGHETEKKQGAHMTMEEQLMAEYKNFINEAKECKVCHEPMKKCKCD